MAHDRPLHWREGMFVRSHHFQQWDAHLADGLKRLIEQLEPDGWGVGHLVINEGALQEERFELREAILVFRDGALVSYPGNAGKSSQASRSFEGRVRGVGAKLGVHLGIRRLQENAANVAEPGEQHVAPTRFLVHRDPEGINDLSTGTNPQTLEFLEYDLRVLFDDEDLQGFDTIRVAEVVRGQLQARPFEISEEYAPPCLRLGASRVLKTMTGGILQQVHRMVGILHQKKPQMFGAEAGAARTLQTALQAVSLNALYPVLVANLEDGRCHPRKAFELLSSLAGAVSSVWKESDPLKIPRYDHLQPAPAFKALCGRLHDDLNREIPMRYKEVELDREGEYFSAALQADHFDRTGRLYLALRSSKPPEQVVNRLKALVKVGAKTRVGDLAKFKLIGVPLEPCPPPGEYEAEADQIFYRITPTGDEWRKAEADGTLGVYLPLDEPGLRASLVLISQEGGA